ncbi:MAG TPA: hypothetical protein VMH28_24265 [Candidatus Acidoferrales bacterium]|nr:hypothetical protein [Candidatus Acidoferrales bacterium]
MTVEHQGSPEARAEFRRFLNWLGEGAGPGAEKYLEMRQRLVRYFDRKNCLTPDELADETLNRVSRRLHEEGAITGASPAHYCYIVARYVFLEYRRQPEQRQISLDALAESGCGAPRAAGPAAEDQTQRQRLRRLEHCLRKLDSADRGLIFEYYRGEQRVKIENRRRLAARLAITMNALSIRACRIRQQLEDCVRGGGKNTTEFAG